ncbi:MAG: adenylate kinase [bacterium]|nr:adenylate kinase [bacterium]
MKVILLGAPGSGKGTVSKLLVEKYGIVQISTGDILRGAVSAGTEIGKKAKEYMEKGDLVPDSVIMGIMEERLQEKDCEKGFILDGFPRTIPQAEDLNKLLARLNIVLDMVVNLEVPEEELLKRLTSRRTCSNADCQEIFNVISNPTKEEGKCDKCGSPVVQRADETNEAIKHRLSTYEEKTAPLIGFYKSGDNYLSVSSLTSETVFEAIVGKA